MTTIVSTILALLPLVIWSIVFLWSPMRTEGEELLRVDMSLLGRVKMVGIPLSLGVIAVLIIGFWTGLRWWTPLVAIAIYGGAVVIPQEYILTTSGIRLGKGPFRRWTEFSGVQRSRSGAILKGGPRSPGYPVFLGGHREDDDFILLLRTLVRDSYKGKTIDRTEITSR